MAIEDIVAQFYNELESAIEYAMETEVADEAKNEIKNAVETEVYNEYKPVMYRRRGEYGGLADKYEMDATYDRSTRTLSVQNVSRDDDTGRLVAPVVESGRGYQYPWNGQKARPFHSVAQEKMAGGKFEEALKRGMTAKGFKIE